MSISSKKHARRVFEGHGGMLRTREALASGIHPRTLYAMRDAGEIDQIARGLFRLADLPSSSEPDLITVAMRIPQGVLCLISALAFHQLTTQVPRRVQLALPRTARHPKLDHPPIQVFRFSNESFDAGVETHALDGVSIRIYSPEKTLADVFKYRNKIGLDVAIEALRTYRIQSKPRFQDIVNYARICRVENVIRPYLEATL